MPQSSPRSTRPVDRLPARVRSLVRYASASLAATAVGLTTLATLVGIGHWSATWSNVVATAVGTIPSFELNRRWVWQRRGRRSLLGEIVPFGGLCLLELVASTLAVRLTADWTAAAGWSHGVRTMADLVANVAAYGTLWVLQYVLLDRFLFAPGGRNGAVPPPGESREAQRSLCPSSANVEEASSGWLR